jgi:hypothetical protein
MLNNGYDRAMALEAVASGLADAVAFGKPFISNPDLVRRLREGAPLNALDAATMFGGNAKGYIDYPTLDEIKRLVKSRYYDLLDDEGMKRLGMAREDTTMNQAEKEQKDVFAGKAYQGENTTTTGTTTDGLVDKQVNDHKVLTRLMCFDIYDIDGDGVNEDVIWWVIKETKTVLRARELTQVYPTNPPRRPFSESCFLPVPGRREGISLLEMMEGLHDAIKQFADQTIDGGTMIDYAMAETARRVLAWGDSAKRGGQDVG